MAEAVRQPPCDIRPLQLCTMLWALSRHESLADVFRSLEHVMSAGHHWNLLCFGSLLMECEQKDCLDREIALLRRIEGMAGDEGAEMGLGKATNRVVALCLAKTNQNLEGFLKAW
eukprot:gnl/TRDRNA2_/TRDRNA2_59137_c0_seq1.p2 gnl/TRDRNA2_/TRDRNA2_59137_c0~~gnl/TRDRNA2_/TRDRNA2_59137_c0_seq1.p2  ORF type:complete len:115 (-),score=13.66 gnl/TRDRNA2_/TRDRNA2_59137_c0_seq1:92-436(-)